MQKQIYKAISLSVCIAVLLFGLVAVTVCYNNYKGYLEKDMKHTCDILMREKVAPEDMRSQLDDALDYSVRVTFFSADGSVVYDSDKEGLEDNHSDRREFAAALKNGSAEATRRSDSLNKRMYYYAVQYNGGVIRFAREYGGIVQLLMIMITIMTVAGGTVVIISTVISVNVAKRLVQPIEQLAKQLEVIDNTGTEPINIRSDCEELAPVAVRIEELYDRLIMQLEDVQKTAQIRREFSANVSHELKTPLTTIKGFGEMLENGIISSPEEVRKYGGTIYRESERLLGLINDIIKISEVEEANSASELMTETDIYALAAEAVKCLEDKAQKHGVKIFLSGSECCMKVQERYIFELIINLVDNAVKYNKAGGSVWVEVSSPVGGGCILCVKDNGIGISEEHQERIFERFYRVDKSRSKLTGGTGLGLSIVKHIAAYHHGTIKLLSRPGEGTQVIVMLPARFENNLQ